MKKKKRENRKQEAVSDICVECGRILPDPIPEERDSGRFEFITTCKCGAVYTN